MLTGVSVRTLHHYEEVGLLVPRERSEAGYRLYSPDDLERLQEILGWRALGFPLQEIERILDEPGHDRLDSLRAQRELIGADIGRLQALVVALDRAIEAHVTNTRQEEGTMFDGFDPAAHEQEARERWGHTDAYKQSARRTAAYSAGDWDTIKAEADAITADFAKLKQAGVPPDGAAARAVALRHRDHISRWFYACPPALHAGLAELYVTDRRFAENYDRVAPELSRYVRDAIVAV